MTKASKKAKATLAEKTAKNKKVEEPVKTQEVENPTPVEAPKPAEEKPQSKEEPQTKDKPAKDEKTKKGKKQEETVIIPEEVGNKENTAVTLSSSLGGILSEAGGNNNDRIDKNHAIEFMSILHKEYLSNPDMPKEKKAVLKKQFDVMTAVTLVNYFTQLEGDFKTMGIRINPEMREQAETVLSQYLGIQIKYVQANDNSRQLVLEFKEVPAEVKNNAKKDAAAAKVEIPEPDPKMEKESKLKALRTIFSQVGAGGIGSNLLQGIEWGRKAFSFPNEEKKAVVLANLLSEGAEATLLTAVKGMVRGKWNTDHSILGAHALLKNWCPSLSDEEVSEIIQVLTSVNTEKRANDWNEHCTDSSRKVTIEDELKATFLGITTGNSSAAISAILKGEEEATVKHEGKESFITIHPKSIRAMLVATYGDSESILKDKIEEIAKYYVRPLFRLKDYADKSAYSDK